MKKPLFVSLVAIFASFTVVLDSMIGLPELSSGVWYSWIFMVEPITGIVLGPYAGFLSTLVGVLIGHIIYFRDIYEFLFTFGAPIGAMVSGLLFKGRFKEVLIYFTLLLVAFFSTPIAWQLPIWGIWDVLLAYSILIVATIISRSGLWKLESRRLSWVIITSAFIGLEADILFRILLFIPGQTFKLFYDFNVTILQLIWIESAIATPIKVAMSILVTAIVGPRIIVIIKQLTGNKGITET